MTYERLAGWEYVWSGRVQTILLLLLVLIPLFLSEYFLPSFEKLIKCQITDVEQIKNKMLHMSEIAWKKEGRKLHFDVLVFSSGYLLRFSFLVCAVVRQCLTGPYLSIACMKFPVRFLLWWSCSGLDFPSVKLQTLILPALLLLGEVTQGSLFDTCFQWEDGKNAQGMPWATFLSTSEDHSDLLLTAFLSLTVSWPAPSITLWPKVPVRSVSRPCWLGLRLDCWVHPARL